MKNLSVKFCSAFQGRKTSNGIKTASYFNGDFITELLLKVQSLRKRIWKCITKIVYGDI